MTETTVLSDLLYDVVPHWVSRIEKYMPKEETVSTLVITPTSISRPAVEDKSMKDQKMSGVQAEAETQQTPDLPSLRIADGNINSTPDKLNVKFLATHGSSRMDAKPDTQKSRFSSINGPVVYYDGESQQMLCDLWNAMNTKRGGLRKEMMCVKKRQAAPKMLPELILDSSDDDDKKKVDGEDDDSDTTNDMLKLRLKMEREKMKRMSRRAGAPPTNLHSLPFKRARMMNAPPIVAKPEKAVDDEALKTLLEAVDDNLDKACKVTETAAFVWLKGDVCEGHLRFILSKLKETAARIEKSGFVIEKPQEKKQEEKPEDAKKMAPPVAPASTDVPQPPEITQRKSDTTMRDAALPKPEPAPTSNESSRDAKRSEAINDPPRMETQKSNPFANGARIEPEEPISIPAGVEVA